jgi:nicotinate (nicotinamide) nucleotide adenylyltransferase
LTVLRKVAILGGAFDPVTEGHIAIAQSVLNTNMFDEVWLTPCFSHLYGKSMMSADHRVKMCGIATRVDRRIRTCMYEIANGLSGATYHFVKQLLNEELADQFDFSIVVGMDNANTFDKWMNYQELEQMIRFVVVPDKPLVECSSTYVREQLVKDTSATFPDSLKGCLDPAVFDYIRKNRLYEV